MTAVRASKRLAALGIITLTAGVLDTVLFAGPAAAAFQCNGTSLNGGGQICIDYDPQGYRAGYKTSSAPSGDWMDFNLHCAGGVWFGSNGSFLANRGQQWYTYVFRVGSKGTCHVTLYDRSTGGEKNSPTVTR
jgi:hypothetical protein